MFCSGLSRTIALLAGVLAMVFLIGYIVLAWQEPMAAPPIGNVDAPLNIGPIAQIKRAGLILAWDPVATGLIVRHGNVGIGTDAPGAKLEVAGQIKITGGSPGADKVLTSDATGLASWRAPSGGGGGIGGSISASQVAFGTAADTIGGDNNLWWDNTNKRLGIGLGVAPAHRLDISGDVRWSGTLQGGSVPWERLTSFPSACSAGMYVSGIGGSLTCSTPAGGGGAPVDATYVVMSTNATLQNERRLTAGSGISISDGGANGNVTLSASIDTTNIINGAVTGSKLSWPLLAPSDGTTANPIYSWQSDQNMGIRRGGADDLRFVTNGADRVTINSSGNVGIGETSPTQRLHVGGNMRLTGHLFDSANAQGAVNQVLTKTANGQTWQAAGGSPSCSWVTAENLVNSSSWGGTAANCASGRAITGGLEIWTGSNRTGSWPKDVHVVYSVAQSNTSWYCAIWNGAAFQNVYLTCRALCCTGISVTFQLQSGKIK